MKPFAFVFPGQGSQAVGMLDAWGDHPAVAETLREASDALGEDVGRADPGRPEGSAGAHHQHPAGDAGGRRGRLARLAAPKAAPRRPWWPGHSLGEYSALVAAGALTLAQAAPLVRFRAQAMQEAVPVGTGAMAAILGMDAQKVIEGCAEATRTLRHQHAPKWWRRSTSTTRRRP